MPLAAPACGGPPVLPQRARRCAIEQVDAGMQRRRRHIELRRAQWLDRCRWRCIAQALAHLRHQGRDPAALHRWRHHRWHGRCQGRRWPRPGQADRILPHLKGLDRQWAAERQHVGHRVPGGRAKGQHHAAGPQQRRKALHIAQRQVGRVHCQPVSAGRRAARRAGARHVLQLDVAAAPVIERQLQLEIHRAQPKTALALPGDIGLAAQLHRQRAAQRRCVVDLRSPAADRVADDGPHGALLGHTAAFQLTQPLFQPLGLAGFGGRAWAGWGCKGCRRGTAG